MGEIYGDVYMNGHRQTFRISIKLRVKNSGQSFHVRGSTQALVLLVGLVVVKLFANLVSQIFLDEPPNISSLSASAVSHLPQRVCAKEEALLNMPYILVTLDTSHFEIFTLNDNADSNM